MADDVRLICWSTPDRLGMGVQIENLTGRQHSSTEEFVQIDTGYSEELLIPQSLFTLLNLERWQLPISLAAQGTTVTGQVIQFIEAPVIVVIPKTGTRVLMIQQNQKVQ